MLRNGRPHMNFVRTERAKYSRITKCLKPDPSQITSRSSRLGTERDAVALRADQPQISSLILHAIHQEHPLTPGSVRSCPHLPVITGLTRQTLVERLPVTLFRNRAKAWTARFPALPGLLIYIRGHRRPIRQIQSCRSHSTEALSMPVSMNVLRRRGVTEALRTIPGHDSCFFARRNVCSFED